MESIVGGLKSLAEGVVTGIGLEGLLIAGGGGMVTMLMGSRLEIVKPVLEGPLTKTF